MMELLEVGQTLMTFGILKKLLSGPSLITAARSKFWIVQGLDLMKGFERKIFI
jgi:hypothetical protein